MAHAIILRRSGRSVAATLPRDMAERLQLKPGDRIFAIETEDGILLTPHGADVYDALQAFAEVRGQFRNVLKKLAD